MTAETPPSDAETNFMRAAFDCSNATAAAYAALTAQTVEFWSNAVIAALPAEEPKRSWYRKPSFAADDAPGFFGSAPGLPSIAWMTASPASGLPPRPFTPEAFTSAWISMMSFQGPPSAWPMAFIMLAAGMPKTVAFPAAEANVAVIKMADNTAAALRAGFGGAHPTAAATSSQVPSLPFAYFDMLKASAQQTWPWFGANWLSGPRA